MPSPQTTTSTGLVKVRSNDRLTRRGLLLTGQWVLLEKRGGRPHLLPCQGGLPFLQHHRWSDHSPFVPPRRTHIAHDPRYLLIGQGRTLRRHREIKHFFPPSTPGTTIGLLLGLPLLSKTSPDQESGKHQVSHHEIHLRSSTRLLRDSPKLMDPSFGGGQQEGPAD